MTDHSRIEGECARYLELLGFLLIRTHNSRNPPTERGIADLIAIRKRDQHPIVIAVEVKAGRDPLSDEQSRWLARARDQAVIVLVIHSLTELQEAVPR